MQGRTALFAGLMIVSVVSVAGCAGFDLGDVVRVKTPQGVQSRAGLPATMTHNEAENQYARWLEDAQADSAEWRAEIEGADQVASLLGQATLGALDGVGPTLAGVPVLGPMLPALTGLAGLFAGRGQVRKEKERSYNAGQQTAAGLIGATAKKG